MIVINKSPTLTHLPYEKDKSSGVFPFSPGNNDIDADVFASVMKTAGETAWHAHYGKFLTPVGGPSETTQTVNLDDLNAREFIDLIEGTVDSVPLNEYLAFEDSGEQRKTVLAAIAKQLDAIAEIETKKAAA